MNRVRNVVTVGVIFLTSAAVSIGMSRRVNHDITVTATLLRSDGHPEKDVCFVANYSETGSSPSIACGRTDASGTATISMSVPIGSVRIIVFPSPLAACCTNGNDAERYKQVMNEYCVQPWKGISVEETQSAYAVQFVAEPAISVRGVIPHAIGEVAGGTVRVGKHFQLPIVNTKTGAFEVRGVARDRTSDVFVCKSGDHWTVVTVSPAPTDTVVDLGAIALSPEVAGVDIHLKMLRRNETARHLASMSKHVTVVRVDGGDVWTFGVDSAGNAYRDNMAGSVPRLPPGTYYVAPGQPGGANMCTSSLVRMAKDGHQAALDAAGVPKLVVTSDGTATVDVDAPAAERAVASAAGFT